MRAVRQNRHIQSGFTLVEILITLAVGAIVLTAAAPSFSALIEKQRLEGAASRLTSDIQWARAAAMVRAEGIRLTLHGDQGGCYLLHTGSAASCTCTDEGASSCTGAAEALKTVGFGAGEGIRLRSKSKSTKVATILFDPLHGTTSPAATLILTAGSGRSIYNIVDILGHVRTCSPSTVAPAVPGYAVC